jgi:hypothetical protein
MMKLVQLDKSQIQNQPLSVKRNGCKIDKFELSNNTSPIFLLKTFDNSNGNNQYRMLLILN